jgi:short subunit fatty acids transporter
VVGGVVLLAGGDLLSLLTGGFGVVVGAVLARRANSQAEESVVVEHLCLLAGGWFLSAVL